MKFLVSRKSVWDNDIKPCEEAKEIIFNVRKDYRTVKTLKEGELKVFWYTSWYTSGRYHREEDGMIVCDVPGKYKRWVVELDSLEDILNFIKKYGDILLINAESSQEFYLENENIHCKLEILRDTDIQKYVDNSII